MESLKFYTVNSDYIDYLAPHEPHLFRNKKPDQTHERKYIGIVLHIGGLDYFAPLSSFKSKHHKMKDSLDFIKIKNYAVINLNCMFPVPKSEYKYVCIADESDIKYRTLLLAEYRYIKSIQLKIVGNAKTIYNLKSSGDVSPLTKRCNDFKRLESLCRGYNTSDIDKQTKDEEVQPNNE